MYSHNPVCGAWAAATPGRREVALPPATPPSSWRPTQRHAPVVIRNRQHGGAGTAERRSARRTAERQVDRLVPLHEGIVNDRDADGLVGRVASGKADGLGHGCVVRGSGGGAVASSHTDAYRARAAACACDRDGGIAPILRHAEVRCAQLYRAGAAPYGHRKVITGSQEREAIVGKQAELIGARSHRVGHHKRTGPGRLRRARRLHAVDIHPLEECCIGSPRRVPPNPVGGAWAGDPTPGRRERPQASYRCGARTQRHAPVVIRNRQHGGAGTCRASRRPSDC